MHDVTWTNYLISRVKPYLCQPFCHANGYWAIKKNGAARPFGEFTQGPAAWSKAQDDQLPTGSELVPIPSLFPVLDQLEAVARNGMRDEASCDAWQQRVITKDREFLARQVGVSAEELLSALNELRQLPFITSRETLDWIDVCRFPIGHSWLVQAAESNPMLLYLGRTHPQLALMLVESLWSRARDQLGAVCDLNSAMELLKIPTLAKSAKLTRKIGLGAQWSGMPSVTECLRVVLLDFKRCQLLENASLPVNPELLRFLAAAEAVPHPRLFRALLELQYELQDPDEGLGTNPSVRVYSQYYFDLERMLALLERSREPVQRLSALSSLARFHDQLSSEYAYIVEHNLLKQAVIPGGGDGSTVWVAPFPGNDDIRPILDPFDLLRIAQEFQNCATRYYGKLGSGTNAMYLVRNGQGRGLLEMRAQWVQGGLRWYVCQFQGPRNRMVSDNLSALVHRWAAHHGVSYEPELRMGCMV